MNAGPSFNRSTWLPIAVLLSIGLLAGCNKPDPAPATLAPASSPCQVSRTIANGNVSKNDEALFAASAAGDLRAATEAIDQGANPNAIGMLKRTPLFVAAFCDRPSLVRMLLEKGANPERADVSGMQPLHAAVVVGATETASILIAGGADINGRDPAGRTALHLAAATDQKPLVELLLARKANAAARDKNGKTAQALARDNGHSATADAIRKPQEPQQAPKAK